MIVADILMERFSTSAPLPNRIHRLHELALDLWWSWRPTARQVFRRLDYSLWRATAHNPVRMLRAIDEARLVAAAQDDAFLAFYDEADRGARRSTRRKGHVVGGERTRSQRQSHRLLLGGVRPASVVAHLRRRPRRSRRRSLQGSQRSGRAARGCRVHVPAGVFSPAFVERRLAGGALRAAQLDRRANRRRR